MLKEGVEGNLRWREQLEEFFDEEIGVSVIVCEIGFELFQVPKYQLEFG
jgi:hypothetical protein